MALSLNFSLRSQNYWLCRLHETKRKLGAKGPEHESSLINEDVTNSDPPSTVSCTVCCSFPRPNSAPIAHLITVWKPEQYFFPDHRNWLSKQIENSRSNAIKSSQHSNNLIYIFTKRPERTGFRGKFRVYIIFAYYKCLGVTPNKLVSVHSKTIYFHTVAQTKYSRTPAKFLAFIYPQGSIHRLILPF